MSETAGIEWTDATWNPTRGCTRVSEGCRNCYAERVAYRFSGLVSPTKGLCASTRPANEGRNGTATFHLAEDHLLDPLKWRKPRRIFVNSMSDLFHEGVPDSYIDQVFAVMALCPQHTFQVLTKRPKRMLAYCTQLYHQQIYRIAQQAERIQPGAWYTTPWLQHYAFQPDYDSGRFIALIPNVHLGVSCENQPTADERIPLLLQTPAAVRYVSLEPLLGPITLLVADRPNVKVDALYGSYGLDWVIVGGEGGSGARPCNVEWIRAIVQQCKAAGVPCFVKQLGSNAHAGDIEWITRDSKGGDIEEFPHDLRVREFPT